jgi:hypothetical protein
MAERYCRQCKEIILRSDDELETGICIPCRRVALVPMKKSVLYHPYAERKYKVTGVGFVRITESENKNNKKDTRRHIRTTDTLPTELKIQPDEIDGTFMEALFDWVDRAVKKKIKGGE